MQYFWWTILYSALEIVQQTSLKKHIKLNSFGIQGCFPSFDLVRGRNRINHIGMSHSGAVYVNNILSFMKTCRWMFCFIKRGLHPDKRIYQSKHTCFKWTRVNWHLKKKKMWNLFMFFKLLPVIFNCILVLLEYFIIINDITFTVFPTQTSVFLTFLLVLN